MYQEEDLVVGLPDPGDGEDTQKAHGDSGLCMSFRQHHKPPETDLGTESIEFLTRMPR